MTLEKKIQSDIVNYIKRLQEKKYPIYYEKRQAGGFNYRKGVADLWIVYNGIHFEIEVKRKDGKMSEMQKLQQRIFKEQYKIDYYLVNSLEEAKKIIGEYIING